MVRENCQERKARNGLWCFYGMAFGLELELELVTHTPLFLCTLNFDGIFSGRVGSHCKLDLQGSDHCTCPERQTGEMA
jgi:hypothetical protein